VSGRSSSLRLLLRSGKAGRSSVANVRWKLLREIQTRAYLDVKSLVNERSDAIASQLS